MSPFGHKDDQGPGRQERLEQWRLEARAELERLSSLPLIELAAEVMIKGFGPGAPGADDDAVTVGQANSDAGPTVMDIVSEFVPYTGPAFLSPEDIVLRGQIAKLVAEGLQQLEHAALVRCQIHTSMGYFDWAVTRMGRAAVEKGEVPQTLRAVSR